VEAIWGIVASFYPRESLRGLALTSRGVHRAVWSSTPDRMLRMLHAARTAQPRDEARIAGLLQRIEQGRRNLPETAQAARFFYEDDNLRTRSLLLAGWLDRPAQAEQGLLETIRSAEKRSRRDDREFMGRLHYDLARVQIQAGKWDDAIASAEQGHELTGDWASFFVLKARALLLKGDLAELRSMELRLGAVSRSSHFVMLAMVKHSLGDAESSIEWLNLVTQGRHFVQFYAWRNGPGDADHAFKLLETTTMGYRGDLMKIAFSPFMRNLWDDPRWAIFVERVGANREGLNAIPFPIHPPEQRVDASH
jgi:hypothetical protein